MGNRRFLAKSIGPSIDKITDLVSYYKCEDNSFDLLDSHGANHGSRSGFDLTSIMGKVNNGHIYNGINNSAAINNLIPSFPFTFGCWFRKLEPTIYILGISTSIYYSVRIFIANDSIIVSFGDGVSGGTGNRRTHASTTGITDSDWHFLTVEFTDILTGKIFIDNVELTLLPATGGGSSVNFTGINFIGRNVGIYSKQEMDEIFVYSKILTNELRDYWYNSGNGRTL